MSDAYYSPESPILTTTAMKSVCNMPFALFFVHYALMPFGRALCIMALLKCLH